MARLAEIRNSRFKEQKIKRTTSDFRYKDSGDKRRVRLAILKDGHTGNSSNERERSTVVKICNINHFVLPLPVLVYATEWETLRSAYGEDQLALAESSFKLPR